MPQKFVELTTKQRQDAVDRLHDSEAGDVEEAWANREVVDRLTGIAYALERAAAVPDHPASKRLTKALRAVFGR